MSKAKIYYHDIGDYLNREEKLGILQKFGSVENPEMGWQILQPNEHGDWLNLRDDAFGEFIPIGDKDDKTNNKTFFIPFYSNGVKTQRDAWCYNSSKTTLETNIRQMLDFYNEQRRAFLEAKKGKPTLKVRDFISYDDTKFSWSDNPINGIETNKEYQFAHYRTLFFRLCLKKSD